MAKHPAGEDQADPGRDDPRPDNELLTLVRTRAYTRSDEPFVLASGGTSYDYVDMRRALARGADLKLAARAVIDHLAARRVEYDAIGGMTMGADPVAHAVALIADKAWFSIRKGEKNHGNRRRVEGIALEGRHVVLFEDTASTGGSILAAYEVAVAAGALVAHACVLFDRGDATRAEFAARSVPYSSLLNYRDLGIEPVVVHRAGC
jgi:orotate phosphoribosyltransferase